ncbi:prenylated rab acceptor family protein [Chloropicon primus]|uniref:PRA1 family protein n=1 Tax=Chloropicon primus TaxID=1764295 RepID=A0A5B8MJR6_9CHLO|nr:prenylated rab acceptor family protein [Chloropicon primus]|eukprot:QDZ20324.1 prenylated rab acceptor family protein [Chloropicon primus]
MSFLVEGAKSTLGKAKEVSSNLLRSSKPWVEFVDRKSFSKPESLTNAVGRVRKNVAYFGVNYLLLMLVVLVLYLIAKPSSIIWLLLLSAMWLYVMAVNPGPVTIGGRTFSQMEKLIGASVVSVLAIFYFSEVGSILLYAALSGVGLICIHGAVMTPENLFSDDGSPAPGVETNQSFLTTFSGAFSNLMKNTNAPNAAEAAV